MISPEKPRIFLSGEVQTDWRKEIIKLFKDKFEFYDPKVKHYSNKHKIAERTALKQCDFVIILLKGRGKGTVREWMLCKRISKRHKVFKNVEDIKLFLVNEVWK